MCGITLFCVQGETQVGLYTKQLKLRWSFMTVWLDCQDFEQTAKDSLLKESQGDFYMIDCIESHCQWTFLFTDIICI